VALTSNFTIPSAPASLKLINVPQTPLRLFGSVEFKKVFADRTGSMVVYPKDVARLVFDLMSEREAQLQMLLEDLQGRFIQELEARNEELRASQARCTALEAQSKVDKQNIKKIQEQVSRFVAGRGKRFVDSAHDENEKVSKEPRDRELLTHFELRKRGYLEGGFAPITTIISKSSSSGSSKGSKNGSICGASSDVESGSKPERSAIKGKKTGRKRASPITIAVMGENKNASSHNASANTRFSDEDSDPTSHRKESLVGTKVGKVRKPVKISSSDRRAGMGVTLNATKMRVDPNSARVGRDGAPVRGAARRALPAYDCADCRAFYERFYTPTKANEMVQECSRHRQAFTPPDTPDGYWDLTVRTPEEWKVQDEEMHARKRAKKTSDGKE